MSPALIFWLFLIGTLIAFIAVGLAIKKPTETIHCVPEDYQAASRTLRKYVTSIPIGARAMRSLKMSTYKFVAIEAKPGAALNAAKAEAVLMALEINIPVRLTHDEKQYAVQPAAILDSIIETDMV